jgi:hypothetical protein
MITMKQVWDFLGDIRVAFILLITASATLMTGAFYAERHFSLFRELNRTRIQDWLPVHLGAQPQWVWWVPLLFVVMGALGINTFICASNRVVRLLRQRRTLPPGRFFYLLTPSLVHFLFLIIMLGHLTTFVAAGWQTLSLEPGRDIRIEGDRRPYRVQAVEDDFFPETAVLHNRIAQTTVTLSDADGKLTRLQYTRPVFMDGRFFLLDKIKKGNLAAKKGILPPGDKETCNKASVYIEADKVRRDGRQLLLVVSDPGLAWIVSGLALIMILMVGYFFVQTNGAGNRKSGSVEA